MGKDNREILEGIKGINRRLDGIEKQLGNMGKRMSSLEERMDNMEKRMSSMEERMDSMEKRMSSMEERMDSMEKRMSSMEERMDSVVERMGIMEYRINNLEDKVDNIENKIIQFEEKMDSECKQLYSAIDNLNKTQLDLVDKMEVFIGETKNNRRHIDKIENKINFNEVVKEEIKVSYLNSGQKNEKMKKTE